MAVCPVARGLVHEAPIPLRDLEGLNVARALDALAPEHKNPAAGDDPRVQEHDRKQQQPDQPHQFPPSNPVATPEPEVVKPKSQLIEELKVNLMDRATSMLLTKDLNSRADHRVVLNSLVCLARKEKAYTFCKEPARLINDVFVMSLKRAFDLRVQAGDDLIQSRLADGRKSRWASFIRGLTSKPYVNRNRLEPKKILELNPELTDMQFLKNLESAEVFSERRSMRVHSASYVMGLLLGVFFGVMCELVALVVIAGFMNALGNLKSTTTVTYPDYTQKVIEFYIIPTFVETTPLLKHLWVFLSLLVGNSDTSIKLCAIVGACFATFEVYQRRAKIINVPLMVISYYARYTFFTFLYGCIYFALYAKEEARLVSPTVQPWSPYRLAVLLTFLHLIWNSSIVLFFMRTPSRAVVWTFNLFASLDVMVREDICLDDFDVKIASTQRDFKVVFGDSICKAQASLWGIWGIVSSLPTIFRACSHNEVISMCGRVGKKLPAHTQPEETARIARNWLGLRRSLKWFINELLPSCNEPMDFYEWASSFPPGRRDELIRTRTNVNDMPELHAKSFIKREVALKNESDIVFKDPRFIQGCPLELSAAVGPTLRPWTKSVRDSMMPEAYEYAEILAGKQVIYTCGLSNEQIGDAFVRCIKLVTENLEPGDEVVFVEDDQSRFDLHLLKGPFGFLKEVYKKKLTRRVSSLLARGVSRGSTSLGTKYSIPYTMQSGWPDTSVGDTLVNAAMKHSIHGSGKLWVAIICGDDSVTVTTKRELERLGGIDAIIRAYADFGMEVEAKVSIDPLDVEFCSGRFYPAGETMVLFPKPGRILSKMCWDQKLRSPKQRELWLRGITATLENFGRIDPLLGALGARLRRFVGEGEEKYDDGWEYKQFLDGTVLTSQHDVLVYYDHHYSLSEADLQIAVDEISRAVLGSMSDNVILQHIALVDIA